MQSCVLTAEYDVYIYFFYISLISDNIIVYFDIIVCQNNISKFYFYRCINTKKSSDNKYNELLSRTKKKKIPDLNSLLMFLNFILNFYGNIYTLTLMWELI